MSDYRDLDWELFTGHMFSKKELDEIYEQGRADGRAGVIEDFKQKSYDIIGEAIHNSNLELNYQLTLYAQIMARIDKLEEQLKEQE